MGGRGSSGERESSNFSVGETLSIDGYKISGGTVTTPSGKSQLITDYKEMTDAQKKEMKSALEKAGINDPVVSGRIVLPRSVAQEAINQKNAEKAAYEKNVPGLDELRTAITHDESQRNLFKRSVYSGSGRLSGNPSSETASSVAKRYPRAAAYIKAESYFYSANDVKSSLGKEAMNAIASGKSESAAIKTMERKWEKYAVEKAKKGG